MVLKYYFFGAYGGLQRTKVPWRFKLHFFCEIVIRCKELEFTFKF